VGVHAGPLSFADLSWRLPVNVYLAYLLGGILRRLGCRFRPYETVPGTVDGVIGRSIESLAAAFLGRRSKRVAAAEVAAWFETIETKPAAGRGPKVAIFGDLYARDNEVMNQGLVRFIEARGGEVIPTPFAAYMRMVAEPYLRKWLCEGRYLEAASSKGLLTLVTALEKGYHRRFEGVLGEPWEAYDEPPERILGEYGVRIEHTGESMENLLKVFYTHRRHPDLDLFVQASPAFCCPSLVTQAMARTIEAKTGVPVVSITYDGTAGSKNDAVVPYLEYARERRAAG
jgi:predicted nucleotide-binding protein (sugar kinase/HSP70/actin superfamily)